MKIFYSIKYKKIMLTFFAPAYVASIDEVFDEFITYRYTRIYKAIQLVTLMKVRNEEIF